MDAATLSLPVPTRRLVLSALSGAALAGTALVIAAPSDAGTAPDMWEATLLAAFRQMNPHQKEAALAGVLAFTRPVRADDDTELLSVLAEFEALERQIYPQPGPATIEEERAWDEHVAPLHERQGKLLDRVCELDTHTLEGFQARA